MTHPLFPPEHAVRRATLRDLAFIRALAKRHCNAVGFIPDEGLSVYVERGDVRLAHENGDAAGYVLGRPRFRWNPDMRPIFQAAVAMDAQRRHHGLSLISYIAEEATRDGQLALQAICREGLDANEFWPAAGFVEIGRLHPWTARKKDLIVWRKLLTPARPLWFDFMPPVAGHKAAKTF